MNVIKNIFKTLIVSVVVLIIATIISTIIVFTSKVSMPLLIVVGVVVLLCLGYSIQKEI